MRRMKTLPAATLGVALVIAGTASAADTTEVVVSASKLGVVTTKQVGRSTIGAPILMLSLSYKVSASDLNLVTNAGVMELERRVKATAKDACEELDKQRPLEPPGGAECIKKATDDAMVKVHALTAAAH